MKRILLLGALLGLLSFLFATPGPDHKVYWCHYPPGQWTGVTGAASHVIILSIDIAAEPNSIKTDKKISAHLGHSVSLTGQTCNPLLFNGTSAPGCAEGVTTGPNDVNGCPGGDILAQCAVFSDPAGHNGCSPAHMNEPLFALCCN